MTGGQIAIVVGLIVAGLLALALALFSSVCRIYRRCDHFRICWSAGFRWNRRIFRRVGDPVSNYGNYLNHSWNCDDVHGWT